MSCIYIQPHTVGCFPRAPHAVTTAGAGTVPSDCSTSKSDKQGAPLRQTEASIYMHMPNTGTIPYDTYLYSCTHPAHQYFKIIHSATHHPTSDNLCYTPCKTGYSPSTATTCSKDCDVDFSPSGYVRMTDMMRLVMPYLVRVRPAPTHLCFPCVRAFHV